MAKKIQLRRDTAANWTAANPILAQGEPAFETDTKKEKIGDGVTPWATLPYKSGGAGLDQGDQLKVDNLPEDTAQEIEALQTSDGQKAQAIQDLQTSNGLKAPLTLTGALENLTTTQKTNLVAAINEIKAAIGGFGNLSDTDIDTLAEIENILGGVKLASETFVDSITGVLENLTTSAKANLVNAINEIKSISDINTTFKAANEAKLINVPANVNLALSNLEAAKLNTEDLPDDDLVRQTVIVVGGLLDLTGIDIADVTLTANTTINSVAGFDEGAKLINLTPGGFTLSWSESLVNPLNISGVLATDEDSLISIVISSENPLRFKVKNEANPAPAAQPYEVTKEVRINFGNDSIPAQSTWNAFKSGAQPTIGLTKANLLDIAGVASGFDAVVTQAFRGGGGVTTADSCTIDGILYTADVRKSHWNVATFDVPQGTVEMQGLDPDKFYEVFAYAFATNANSIVRFGVTGDAAIANQELLVTDNVTAHATWVNLRPSAEGAISLRVDKATASSNNYSYLSAMVIIESNVAKPV